MSDDKATLDGVMRKMTELFQADLEAKMEHRIRRNVAQLMQAHEFECHKPNDVYRNDLKDEVKIQMDKLVDTIPRLIRVIANQQVDLRMNKHIDVRACERVDEPINADADRRGYSWSIEEDNDLASEMRTAVAQIAIAHKRTPHGIFCRIRDKKFYA